MSILEFIILAIALSFEALIVMHGCTRQLSSPLRLSKGMAESVTIGIINALMLAAGMLVGSMLRFTPPGADPNSETTMLWNDTDNLVYLGLLILVAVRLLFRSGKKNRQVQPYDISRFTTAILLGVAIGINTLIVGLALGFRLSLADNAWRATITLAIITMLFSMLGIMLGRQRRDLRANRYTLIAVLFLLAFALKGAFWS